MNSMSDINQVVMDLPNEGVERRPSYNISYECHDSFIFDELSKLADEDSDDDSLDEGEVEGRNSSGEKPALDDTGDQSSTRARNTIILSLGNSLRSLGQKSLRSLVEDEAVEEPLEDEPNGNPDQPPSERRPSLVAQFQNRVIRREESAGNIARAASFGAFGRRSSFSSRRNSWGSEGRAGSAASFDLNLLTQASPALSNLRNETFQQNQSRTHRAASSAGRALLDR